MYDMTLRSACVQKVINKELRDQTIFGANAVYTSVCSGSRRGPVMCPAELFSPPRGGVWRALGASGGHKMEQSGVSSGVKRDEK